MLIETLIVHIVECFGNMCLFAFRQFVSLWVMESGVLS